MAAILRHRVIRPQEERAATIGSFSRYILLFAFMSLSVAGVSGALAASVDPLEHLLGGNHRVGRTASGSLLAAVPVTSGGSPSYPGPIPSPEGRPHERSLSFPSHPSITKQIHEYAIKDLEGFQEMLDRAWIYLPMMKEILDVLGAPSDLLAVVFVESRFRGHVSSGAGASGFWQLMPKTARTLGLRVDGYVDERFDPIKSTRAAAVYLLDLYEQFGSWELALAAYNAGDGAVRGAMRRCCSSDFWVLWKKGALPNQTRRFVPKVLAAVEILRNFQEYGLQTPTYAPLWAFTTVWVHRPLTLSQASQWTGVPLEDLKRLNPALRRGQIPQGTGYQLRLPPAAVETFLLAYEKFMNKRT